MSNIILRWIIVTATLASVAFVVTAPLLVADKVYVTDDLVVHYQWSTQFHEALQEGVLFPRWMPRQHHGLGEASFIYYPPLYFYEVALLRTILGDTWAAMKSVALLTVLFAGLFAFRIAQRYTSPLRALAIAVFVQLVPLPVHLLYYQSLIPFHASLPWYILFMGAMMRQADTPRWFSPSLAFAMALMVFAHILSSFMLIVCFGGALLITQLIRRDFTDLRTIGGTGLSMAAGLLLSAVYLLPAMTSWDYIELSQWFEPGYLDWRNSFAFPVVTWIQHGTRWFSVQWIMGAMTLILAALATVAGRTASPAKVRPGRSFEMLMGAMVIALFLSSEFSYPLWRYMDFVQKVQFPYRYLFVASLCAILALASGLRDHVSAYISPILAIGLIGLSLQTGGLLIRIARTGVDPAFDPITLTTDAYYNPMNYFWVKGRGDGWRTYLAQGGLEGHMVSLGVDLLDQQVYSHKRTYHIHASEPVQMKLPVEAYPAWAVRINDQDIPLQMDQDSGLIKVSLPAGEHVVHVEWAGLRQEHAGRRISSLTAFAVLALAVWFRISLRQKLPLQ